MKLRSVAMALSLAVIVWGVLSNSPSTKTNDYLTALDVSWPNCTLSFTGRGNWGIVGVTGGLDFRHNPCLVKEASWFKYYALYINTGYPGSDAPKRFPSFPRQCTPSDKNCLAYNYGYNAALYAIDYTTMNNIHSNSWWLDVETINSWTNDVAQNRASLQGMIDAISHYTVVRTIGIYSVPTMWQTITGGWHNLLPVWRATGSSTSTDAQIHCGQPSFTGGSVYLTQYTPSLDKNYACSTDYLTTIYNH